MAYLTGAGARLDTREGVFAEVGTLAAEAPGPGAA
jgi:hypothetical protein